MNCELWIAVKISMMKWNKKIFWRAQELFSIVRKMCTWIPRYLFFIAPLRCDAKKHNVKSENRPLTFCCFFLCESVKIFFFAAFAAPADRKIDWEGKILRAGIGENNTRHCHIILKTFWRFFHVAAIFRFFSAAPK